MSQVQLPKQLILTNGEQEWKLDLDELGISLDKETMLAESISLLEGENIWARYWSRRWLSTESYTLQTKFEYNCDILMQALAPIAEAVSKEPVDARLVIEGDSVIIEDGENGTRLNTSQTKEKIIYEAANFAAAEGNIGPVNVVMETWSNSRSRENLLKLGLKQKMAGYSTGFSNSVPTRTTNIRLSTTAIDGTIIMPGEEFSFSEIVGPINSAQGYKPAPVIMNGDLVQGVGGGVCQVSTTLYNAALLSNLEITERHNHGLPVGYIPLGLDATIAQPYLDLRFRNPYDHAILIKGYINNGRIYFNIYGQLHGEKVEVATTGLQKIQPPVKEEYDPSLAPGTKKKIKTGSPGYRITSWRLTYRDGKIEKKELLSRDQYKATPTVYLVGPEPAPKTEQPVKETAEKEDGKEEP